MKNEELNIKNLTQDGNTTKNNRRKVCCSLKFGESAGARTAKPKRGYLIAQPQASNNFNYPRNP